MDLWLFDGNVSYVKEADTISARTFPSWLPLLTTALWPGILIKCFFFLLLFYQGIELQWSLILFVGSMSFVKKEDTISAKTFSFRMLTHTMAL